MRGSTLDKGLGQRQAIRTSAGARRREARVDVIVRTVGLDEPLSF